MQNAKPVFASGYGQSDTRKGTGKNYAMITIKEIAAMAKEPPSRAKEAAQWFIPSTYAEHDARNHNAQRAHGMFYCLTLDVDENNLALSDIDETLDVVIGDAARLIYSSRSATTDARKWRALIPLKAAVSGLRFSDVQNAFYDLLEQESEGVLIPDRALARPAQLVYLPNRGDFYEYLIDRGTEILDLTPDTEIMSQLLSNDMDVAYAAQVADEAREERIAQRRTNSTQAVNTSPVDAFNAAHTVPDLLARYGYKQNGSSDNWRSPFQSSGSFATHVFGDHWVSLSASDAAQGLGTETVGGGRYGDAFDLFVHFEHSGDFNKAVAAYGAEIRPARMDDLSDFPEVKTDSPSVPTKHLLSSFKFTKVGDLEYREPEFLIDTLIETDTVSMIFGDPGCGKSFVAVDIGACVASGQSFHGNVVKQGSVFMIAGEGHNGLARRFAAWSKDRGVPLDGVPLFKSERAAQFLDQTSAKAVADAVDALAQEHGTPTLIIIDTVARNFGAGDENSTSDMSNFIASIDDLRARYHGCAILLVHHSGHSDKQRARGAMALKGALDCEFRVQKDGDRMQMVNTKMKDAEPPEDMHFTLKSVTLTGEAQSAVLQKTEGRVKKIHLTPTQKLALDTYTNAGIKNSIWDGGAFRGVHLDDWRAAFYAKHTGDNLDTKRQAFSRVRKELASAGLMRVENDVYLATDSAATMAITRPENPQRDKRDKALHSEECHGAEAR